MKRGEVVTHVVVPVLILIAATLAAGMTRLDFAFSDLFYDFDRGVWSLRDHWLIEGVLHHGGRWFVELIGLSGIVVWIGSWIEPEWRTFRRGAAFLVLAMSLSIGVVSLAKHNSSKHCPWDIVRYGGTVPIESLCRPSWPGTGAGHCFPSSHASVGYSLVALYFVIRDRSRRMARAALAFGLLVGTVFAVAQIARGAHYLSHVIWSAVACWYISLGLYEIGFDRRMEMAEEPSDARLASADAGAQPLLR